MDCTNEELTMRIRQGEADLFPQLWKQNKPLLLSLANKLYSKFQLRCVASGVDTDDLQQACMLALWGAVNVYDPEKGFKLTAYFKFQVKRQFYNAVGMRKAKQALDHAASLDAELPNKENGLTLGDTIPDAYAAEQMEAVEDRCYNEVLRERLDYALSTLPDRTRKIIQGRYYQNRTLEDIAQEYSVGVEWARQLERNGLNALRKFDRLHHGYLSVFLGYGFTVTREQPKIEAEPDKVQDAFDRAEALQDENPDLDYAEIVRRLLAV